MIAANMPTPTLSQSTFINLGPLTTTWTAPAACATITRPPALARRNDGRIGVPFYQQTCDINADPYNDCIPSGREMNSIYSTRRNDPARNNVNFYYSPANQCPSGWSTVGFGVRAETSFLSLSGVFANPTLTLDYGTSTRLNSQVTIALEPSPNFFMSAMEPQETAIMCCPR